MKKYAKKNLTFFMALFFLFFGGPALAGDLDDGISKFTDETISADDSLGQADTNVNFIIVKALSDSKKKYKSKENREKGRGNGSGSPEQGLEYTETSVIVGPGAKTGDITNIIIEKK